MRIEGFETRKGTIAKGMFVISFPEVLDADRQRAVLQCLAEGDVCEAPGDAALPARSRYVAGRWEVPTDAGIEAQRSALRRLETEFRAMHARFLQVSTEIDMAAAEAEDGEGSHWKAGPPPEARTLPFPIEGYPDILEAYDGEDFGIALKLAPPQTEGEDVVLDAFHTFWLSPYVDEEVEDGVPFRHAQMTWDGAHRAGVLWVDRFAPPASTEELVHHLMWIAQSVHAIVPVQYARFAGAETAITCDGASEPLVLAGNPFAAKFAAEGEAAAAAWAETQSGWTRQELAAMFIEVGKQHDPDDPESGPVALRMFDRAGELDPTNAEAKFLGAIVLTSQGRSDEAIARAEARHDLGLRARTLALVAETGKIPGRAASLISRDTLAELGDEALGELVLAMANHAPEMLEAVLASMPPARGNLVAHLYNAGCNTSDPKRRIRVFDHVLAMPEPGEDSGPNRNAWTMAWNNACVTAHAVGDFAKAKELADGAQPYARENPYIYHAAACAYAATGDHQRAFEQVKGGVEADYDFIERMEKDTDLGPILEWPEFRAIFAAWRERMAQSEGVLEVSDADFEEKITACPKVSIVDFTASWCGPCRHLAPIVEKLARGSGGRFRVAKLDIDANADTKERFGVRSVPTLIVFRDGKEAARHVGLTDLSTLRKLIDQVAPLS